MSEKINWDNYFLSMAYFISIKSPDTSTKHGCIFVDKDHRVISLGYNGYLSNINDENVPKTRPEKYFYTLHSEENAILFRTESLEGATAYITGYPCSKCLRMMLQCGVSAIVIGCYNSNCISEEEKIACEYMLKEKNIKIKEYTKEYIEKNVISLYDVAKEEFVKKMLKD
jgi:dCMP deaminase